MSWSSVVQDHPGTSLAHPPGHARFPSSSDSASVYSRAYFSPPCPEQSSTSFGYNVHSTHHRPSGTVCNSLSDPAASGLDFDDEDDTDSCFNTADTTGDSENEDEDEDEDASHRMSIQGPKIRFHSRAPWEIGEDTFEDEESDYSGRSVVFGRKAKTAEAGLMQRLGRVSSRPSGESNHSQVQPKASFETTARPSHSSSRGALYTLVQESFSNTSLTVPSYQFPPHSPRNRHNFSLPRTINYPHTTYSDHTHGESQSDCSSQREMTHTSHSYSPRQDTHSPHSSASEFQGEHERSATLSSFQSSQDRLSDEDFIHPYANPDLVASYSPPRPVPPLHSTFENFSRSDSATTVIDSPGSYSSAFSCTMMPDTSTSPPPSREHTSSTPMRINGKDISHPIAVFHSSDLNSTHCNNRTTKLMSLQPPLIHDGIVPGWHAQPSSTVTLISLQEAQARERTRSAATVNSTASLPSQVHEVTSRAPFSELDDSVSIASTETSAVGGVTRSRARSISAGTRAKGVLHSVVGTSAHKSERRDSEPAAVNANGQTLKHKRSGFMRLFNGQREKGRDKERSPPPPVPSLRRIYSKHPHGAIEEGKSSTPVILPHLSPSTTFSQSDTEEGPSSKLSAPSLKRTPPPLHITTGAKSAHSPVSIAPLLETGATDFLKLRPASTTFSSQFADIVAIPEVESISELELNTPTSPSTISSVAALSPFTSGSSRPSDDKPSPVEQSLIIKALQEQIISSKKAWQRQVWELQGQVRDLKTEIENLRATNSDNGHCEHCGRGNLGGDYTETLDAEAKKVSVLSRPRGRIGDSARFASGN